MKQNSPHSPRGMRAVLNHLEPSPSNYSGVFSATFQPVVMG
jgi:hypothetical protein